MLRAIQPQELSTQNANVCPSIFIIYGVEAGLNLTQGAAGDRSERYILCVAQKVMPKYKSS